MKRSSLLLFLFVIPIAVASLAGCSSTTSSNANTVLAGLNTVVGTKVTRSGDSSYGRIVAEFFQSDGKTLRAVDTVRMNGIAPIYSALNKYYVFDSTALPNDGALQWHVVGQNGIASFDQSVFGNAHLRISAPAPTDTISRSAGFTVTWTPSISGGLVNVAIDDGSASPPTISSVADNGSLTLAPSQISAARVGAVTLYVYRETVLSQVFSGGIYQFDSQAQSRVDLYLKP